MQTLQTKLIDLFEHNSDYQNSRLRAFLTKPSPNEADLRYFLRFQTHFYHFVRVFSKMLARCASDIEHTKHRIHLIENLMCEHGLPTGKPHVKTYLHYLNCLAKALNQKPLTHDEVRNLDDNIIGQIVWDFEHFSTPYPDDLLFLGGIEYVYAVISQDVVVFLNQYSDTLAKEQEHYAIHADLDWEHGWELVEIYLDIQQDNKQAIDEAHIFQAVQAGAKHLIAHIEQLMALETVFDKPLGFYHSREDINVERQVIEQFFNTTPKLKVLAICGGGENYAHLASALPNKHFDFDFIDINPNQLALTQAKLTGMTLPFDAPHHTGKFEHLFAELRRYDNLEHACNTVFHRDNLIEYFGEQAVLGCHRAKDDALIFARHFYQALSTRPDHWNTQNILHNAPISTTAHTNLHANTFIEWDIAQPSNAVVAPQNGYDLIILSNVPDWIIEHDIPAALSHLAPLSGEHTYLIVRKLLSDYDIYAVADKAGWQVVATSDDTPTLKDQTGFYKQTFILKLKP